MLSQALSAYEHPVIYIKSLFNELPNDYEKKIIESTVFKKTKIHKVKHIPQLQYIPTEEEERFVMRGYVIISMVYFSICSFGEELMSCPVKQILVILKQIKDELYNSLMTRTITDRIREISYHIIHHIAQ